MRDVVRCSLTRALGLGMDVLPILGRFCGPARVAEPGAVDRGDQGIFVIRAIPTEHLSFSGCRAFPLLSADLAACSDQHA
jgi:hypothetical protein